jgi:hypothetical protein
MLYKEAQDWLSSNDHAMDDKIVKMIMKADSNDMALSIYNYATDNHEDSFMSFDIFMKINHSNIKIKRDPRYKCNSAFSGYNY